MSLSVLQWNVWYEEDIDRVLDFLQAHPADVICLQELTRGYIQQTQQNTWEYLSERLAYHCHHVEMPVFTDDAQWTQANAILSKYPIVASDIHEFSKPAIKNPSHQTRAYLDITIKFDDADITIGTTHLSFTANFQDSTLNQSETDELLQIISEKSTRPYIFTADTNSLPGSYTIKRIGTALDHAGPDFDEKTWTTKPHVFSDTTIDTLDWRLDYIYYKHLSVEESAIIPSEVSDHLPILARFRVNPSSS